jgi:hypothetical protein
MLTKSKDHNPNYLAKVVALKGLKKHSNADRLQTVDIDFQTVITGMDAKEGDIYVYFPLESKINKDFLSSTNSFRDKELNGDKEKTGFFGDKGRVRAMKLRGEKSMGYVVPSFHVAAWSGVDILPQDVGTEFDTIGDKLILEKYQIKEKTTNSKQGKKPKVSRLVDGQIHLHADTENLRRNAHKINPQDTISITYKTHGTSWWVSNVLVKRSLSFWEKLGQKLGINVQEFEYDLVYGSRRVVKNPSVEDPKQKDHFFGYDLWEKIKDEVGDKIPKGFTLYGEMLGYDHNGKEIQGGYDYGCKKGEHKLEVYRITQTTPDGLVTELTYPEIEEFCTRAGLNAPHLYFYGEAVKWFTEEALIKKLPTLESNMFDYKFVSLLEEKYNDKPCFMCNNKVPEEGIVVRKESLFSCESYKLKSFSFLEKESKELDKGVIDIESDN